MAPFRRFAPVLVGVVAATACKDPKPTTGSLLLNITGVPAGGAANVRVTSGSDFFQQVTATTTLDGLAPGDYAIRVDTITHANNRYGVAVVRDTFTVGVGQTQTADISYGLASGSLDMTITGLPPGTNADVKLVSPGFSTTVAASGVVAGLPPGKIYIHSDTFFTTLGDRVGSAKVLDSVTIPTSLTPATGSVAYGIVSATLAVTVNGMPTTLPQLQQPVSVSGPSGYTRKTTATETIRGLNSGTYTITAANANGNCPTIYKTSFGMQTLTIGAGETGAATINYTEGPANPAELNLRIEKVHLIQVTQDDIGSVPMIANRDALVRVYGVANQCNEALPKVRVTLGTGQQYVINAPEQMVRYKTETGTLISTWNVTLPKEVVQPNLTVVAEIDHDTQVTETSDSDNRFPSSGTLGPTVKTVPPIGIKLVPLVNSGLTGDISTSTLLDLPKRLHPITEYDVVSRSPYTTQPGSGSLANSAAWETVLEELDDVRIADSETKRYYYGIARVTSEFGTAGIGFIFGKTAMGWDHVLTASEVMAHELGHNFGRVHAPSGSCGATPNLVDPSYPRTGLYIGGKIGVYGYDQVAQALKSPETYNDIMGYCRTLWISDYMYVGMMNFLSDPNRGPTLPSVQGGARQPALLISGRIDNGRPVLKPSFELDAVPELPSAPGPHRIVGIGESGEELFSLSFAAKRIAHADGIESFAFAVPQTFLRGQNLASIRLTSGGRTVTNVVSGPVTDDPRVVATRVNAGRVRLQWDAARFPVVMVRDRQTGDVLSFARGGDMTIAATRDDLEMSFSNRVRSARRQVQVRRQ